MSRPTLLAGTLLLALIAVLLCLIPKPENDLFFELRTGTDILDFHRLPHFDTYSWPNRGTRWDVPEWLAFAVYALSFRGGGFLGTWLVLAALTIGAAWVVWFRLVRVTGPIWAFFLSTLMLLAMKDTLQERPYAFTYLLLAVSLCVLLSAREGRPTLLLWLPPLCILWTNLHQGVLSLVALLLVYALGDALAAIWKRQSGKSAWRMLSTAAVSACAVLVSPYGWRVYWNVLITLRDRNLMANVTEWNPVTALPLTQLEPFLLLAALAFGSLALSQKRNLADTLAVAALFGQGLLHARNIPLFAIGGTLLMAPHFASALPRLRHALGLPPTAAYRPFLLSVFALLLVAAVGLLAFVNLHKSLEPRGGSPQGIGEAVAGLQGYPEEACAFMDAEKFPTNLRLLNGFETGGFLLWRRPEQPVFVDGRLDVYVGKTFDDMLVLARAPGSPPWAALVKSYDFDCVVTTHKHEADAFAAAPSWQLVYRDPRRPNRPRFRILLRRRPEFAGLIARCLQDGQVSTN